MRSVEGHKDMHKLMCDHQKKYRVSLCICNEGDFTYFQSNRMRNWKRTEVPSSLSAMAQIL